MAKGKPWTVEEERQLRQPVTEKKSIRSIAKILDKTVIAVRLKAFRLSLEDDDGSGKNNSSSSTFDKLVLPDELPSIEEKLKTLVGALQRLEKPPLDKIDVLRLRTIIQGAKVYQDLIAEYIDYRGLEAQEMLMKKKIELRRLTRIG